MTNEQKLLEQRVLDNVNEVLRETKTDIRAKSLETKQLLELAIHRAFNSLQE